MLKEEHASFVDVNVKLAKCMQKRIDTTAFDRQSTQAEENSGCLLGYLAVFCHGKVRNFSRTTKCRFFCLYDLRKHDLALCHEVKNKREFKALNSSVGKFWQH